MDIDALSALAGIAVSMTWTPGPNNMMLAAAGANAGWVRGLPHALGVAIGFPVMLILVALGLGQVFEAWPPLATVLRWIGLAAMVWFAWMIATAKASGTDSTARPLTFLEACGFQWVNPKAWAFAIWVTASHADGLQSVLIAAGVFLLSGLGSAHVWLFFGSVMGRALGTGARLRAFNIAMALLLLGCAVWLMWQS